MTYAAISDGKDKDERKQFDRDLLAWPTEHGDRPRRGPDAGIAALMAAAKMPQKG